MSVLVAAGEASGDRIAAAFARAHGGPVWGMAGAASRAAGVDVALDLASLTASGLVEAASRLPAIVRAYRTLLARVDRVRPRAAVLVDFSEFNTRLGVALRARGVPVLRVVAPQTWAWRPGRVKRLGDAADRVATLFAFEVPALRAAGVDARWVGHPAVEAPAVSRADARTRLSLSPQAVAVALLPGSRPGEVSRIAEPMLAAGAELAREGASVVVLRAPSLDAATRVSLAASARAHGLRVADVTDGLEAVLPAFDAAIATAGTATLEAALLGVPPVVTYRASAFTALAARRLLRVSHVGLPNVLLDQRVYPELLQEHATGRALAAAARALILAPPRAAPHRLRTLLAPPDERPFGARVASLVPA